MITVTIESIGDTETYKNDFTKREFVAIDMSNPQYPQPIKFEVVKDKCSLLDDFAEGQEVDVHFNIRGRKWTDPKNNKEVVFNSLAAWKIEPKGVQVSNDMNPNLEEPAEDPNLDLPF